MRYNVPLIPQKTEESCWAASAAMILSWKSPNRMDPKKLARNKGFAKQYARGLNSKDAETVLKRLGLAPEPPQNMGPRECYQLLQTYGPLWVTGFQKMSAASQYATHARVVTGMDWSSDPDGSIVYINDPWDRGSRFWNGPANKGSQYPISYSQLRKDMEDLASELNRRNKPFGIFVAHLPLPFC